MRKFRSTETCPICHMPLEDRREVNKKITVKACPNGHFKKEVHPLLGTTFEFYQKPDEKGVNADA
ncbi:hypothetical protein LC040_03630 [Bacillus tianshenii]|nr:hypothetical protein LC040_03630 [Bacillus tianshenii]